ncbi:hypothetical protein B296_00057827, partial [Ensete ventricosum]
NTDTTPRNVMTCSTKLKTLSGVATCGDMYANNPLSLTVDPLETHLPDLRARSRSKSTSSLVARHQAATAPRREKLMRDPRPERGRCIMKTLTSHLADAHLRALAYRRAVTKLYNHRVRCRHIETGDLVLQNSEVSDPTRSRGKLAPNWMALTGSSTLSEMGLIRWRQWRGESCRELCTS